ncbi:MAG: glycerol-3-phosphate dehydrogenase/oxidase [Anaerolineae bacterium]|jgi:glycerol-3-phosphate dehydrogenase
MIESSPSLTCSRPFSATTRRENLKLLRGEVFDLLVIGGGITGVSIARDAAMRGFRTALVEKEDFGSGTSSRSARMIHGGLRYLENYQFGLVFRCCSERREMRKVAPRLVRSLPFLYPLYLGQKPAPWKLRLGLTLYDALGLFQNVQPHRWLEPREVTEREPLLGGRGLLGAARFYDAQVDDARLTLLIARAAHAEGTVVVNYAKSVDLLEANGKVQGAVVLDRISEAEFELRARVVVNATGIWADSVRQQDAHYRGSIIRPTKGIHLVLPRHRLPTQHAIAFDSPRDGRHIFLIPWDKHALVGTTDTDYEGDLNSPAATWEDVEYLLEALAYVFPGAQMGPDDIISTFAGLRPLLYAEGGTYALSREHEILESPSGLITIAGGKLTTARLMAEQIVDRVERKLEREFRIQSAHACRTKEPLPAAKRTWVASAVEDQEAHAHLIDAYGADAAWVLAYAEQNAALRERIVPELPYLMAEALYAVQHEMALTLSDVLIRRTHVIYEARNGGREQARAVAGVMASRLEWDKAEIEQQTADYLAQVALTQAWRSK